tara:strand:+ start:452 stop:1501 length:1050 start_codon:yes stop_codon:yes gene_type:complete
MNKYYTRACNFYYGKTSSEKLKKKLSLPLNGNKLISFDTIEILKQGYSKKIHINDIRNISPKLRNKITKDLTQIKKKKYFKNLNFSHIPILMGIVNITPDSFSDGGKYNSFKKSLIHIKNLINSGCDIVDIGGESTRPGSKAVDEKIEWKRVSKTLKKIAKFKKFISIDTRKSYVMERSYKYNINLINDISGLKYDNKTLSFLKKTKLPFVINHSKGLPENMQKNPNYKNVLFDIYDYFEDRIKDLRSFGINHNNIILDPGIGFGKNLKHNMILLKNVSIFHSLGFPLLIGNSRKKFIKDISNMNDSPYRLGGTISSSLYLMLQGVQILRIHDINELKQAIKVFEKLNF